MPRSRASCAGRVAVAAGDQTANVDFAEGAIVSLSDQVSTLATPYSGELSIPRELIRKLIVFGEGRRLVIDPAAHHLGDEVSLSAPVLDPPQPEGDVLERTFELAEVADRPGFSCSTSLRSSAKRATRSGRRGCVPASSEPMSRSTDSGSTT